MILFLLHVVSKKTVVLVNYNSLKKPANKYYWHRPKEGKSDGGVCQW